MRARSVTALARKELRELFTSRAFVLVACATGALVAHAYSTAVTTYAEVSVDGALRSAISPLDGFVVPLLGAYAIVATLLFPFVAIRSASAEKESGAHALALQSGESLVTMVIIKFKALMIAWMALWLPAVTALLFWRAGGGHLATSEVAVVLLGHLLRGAFVTGVGLACASLTTSGSSAAVLALAVTLGGWALDFTASIRGGWSAALARFTPDAALRQFEHGVLSLSVVVVSVIAAYSMTGVAMIWLDPARRTRARVILTVNVLAAATFLGVGASRLHRAWDLSEDRRNSFDAADAALLATITQPLRIEVHLGPEDPRRTDLDRGVIEKLERTIADVRVVYDAQTSTGLFEGQRSRYGEVWYDLGGKRAMSRSTTVPIVLETIYALAGLTPPQRAEPTYPGYPLKLNVPLWQTLVLLGLFPLMFALTRSRKRRT